MNRKVSKRITRQVKEIIVEWFGKILADEEAAKVTTANCFEFMPDQTHFYAGRTMYLNAYHPKWISNKIKKMLKSNPTLDLETITLGDIQCLHQP
jgi:hypothetical protein